MITLKNPASKFVVTVPESINEIPVSYLEKVTKHITLSENYVLVSVISTIDLAELLWLKDSNSNRQPKIDVTAVIAKSVYSNLPVGKVVIMSPTDLQMAVHVDVPCSITTNNIIQYIGDGNYAKDIKLGAIVDTNNNPISKKRICVLAFKIVPVANIHAIHDLDGEVEDDFINLA